MTAKPSHTSASSPTKPIVRYMSRQLIPNMPPHLPAFLIKVANVEVFSHIGCNDSITLAQGDVANNITILV